MVFLQKCASLMEVEEVSCCRFDASTGVDEM